MGRIFSSIPETCWPSPTMSAPQGISFRAVVAGAYPGMLGGDVVKARLKAREFEAPL